MNKKEIPSDEIIFDGLLETTKESFKIIEEGMLEEIIDLYFKRL